MNSLVKQWKDKTVNVRNMADADNARRQMRSWNIRQTSAASCGQVSAGPHRGRRADDHVPQGAPGGDA